MGCQFGLKDKLVFVAGGSGLIGKAIVEALLDEEAKVVNCDIKGGFYFDMSQPTSIFDAIDLFGVPDGFVNATYPRDFVTHSNGFMQTSLAVIGQMSFQHRGSIVNMSSIYGVDTPDWDLYQDTEMVTPSIEYAFEKAGIIQMTKWLAKRYGLYGIRANAVSPGGVEDGQPESFVNKYVAKTPLGRMAKPGDIAPVVLFLLSDASRYITGQNIVVDGGWTL